MEHWLDDATNKENIQRLRSLLAENDIPIFIFLGAGLSFGVGRDTQGAFELIGGDDYHRFPSWPQLIRRMKKHLLSDHMLQPFEDYINQFFEKESALDCAELFHHYTQGPNYWDFLERQFGSRPDDEYRLTSSHYALVRLPVTRIFTTNYDELIETVYRKEGIQLLVSSSSHEFMDNRAKQKTHHLIKLHGSIAHPKTIVLTRLDYAKSRHERFEMFKYLTDQFEYSAFLFVGFSLLDPNFNILFDEAHYVRGETNPVSYVVQARKDPLRESYLKSLGVNSITLDNWEQLSIFLKAINPETDLASLPHS